MSRPDEIRSVHVCVNVSCMALGSKDLIDALTAGLEGTDIEAIKSGIDLVSTTSQSLGQALYQEEQNAAASGGVMGDDVVDAEIVDDQQ
mgnify:CR=1 FL=1